MLHKTSQTDFRKRTELFYEFLYYVFDSILIPLLRSNFYITESNTDKYRLFYFRHDVWRYVAEPAMAALKVKMFEEVNLDEANRLLDSRQLGFSQVRLLPKGMSLRPIMNLRKKMLKRGNKTLLGPSINTLLKPVHTILQLEKVRCIPPTRKCVITKRKQSLNPAKLGSSMTSVGDIYMRLAAFKSSIGTQPGPLFFAKVDVQSAFDTIPQAAIVGLLDSIPQRRGYQIAKHVEITHNGSSDFQVSALAGASTGKPRTKWLSTAMKHRGSQALLEYIESDPALKKNNTVFIEDVFRKDFDTSSILRLVASHIQQNLVKIGKKFFRQKEGIPQGSILSSTLCNYFYADLEFHVLKFLDSPDCLLLRLIDDFLLVTTDKTKASRFVEVMHAGVPEYGVVVNPAKTLVNFDLYLASGGGGGGGGGSRGTVPVPRVGPGANTGFPYCGALIDTNSLNVSKDRRTRRAPPTTTIQQAQGGAASNNNSHKTDAVTTSSSSSSSSVIFDSLTVEYARAPGRTFQRKVLNAFKIQSHLMYLDTGRLNSAATVLSNLRAAFCETAAKTWAYVRCLPPRARPPAPLVIRALGRLADVAYLVATSRARRARYPGYTCDVRKIEVTWLAYSAFAQVLGRKQSSFGPVLDWLNSELKKLGAMKDIRRGRVAHIAEKAI
jgi:telomerase reverse transcriptase